MEDVFTLALYTLYHSNIYTSNALPSDLPILIIFSFQKDVSSTDHAPARLTLLQDTHLVQILDQREQHAITTFGYHQIGGHRKILHTPGNCRVVRRFSKRDHEIWNLGHDRDTTVAETERHPRLVPVRVAVYRTWRGGAYVHGETLRARLW
jgi:hypothetical protein